MTTKIFNAQGQANNWSDTKNWVGGVVPGSADVALLNGVGSKEFTGPISVGTVMLLGASNVAFDGTVNTSGEGFCRGIMVCNGGTMTFNAGSTLNDLAGSLNIGVHAVGGFIANGTAGRSTVINTADALVGQFAQGIGTITIDDATWNASGTAMIGGDGTGSVDVRDGGQINIGGNLALAVSNTSFGNVTVEAGSTINVTGTAGFGTSQADQTSGGVATVTVNAGGTLNIGHWLFEGSTSSLILNGGAVNLGTSGQGWIVLQSGGTVSGHGTLSSMSNVLLDNGLIKAQGGTLEIKSNVSGTGGIDIGANSAAKLDGSAIQASVIDFTGANGSLEFQSTARVTSQINDFTAGDKIIFDTMIDSVKWQASTGSLALSSGGHVVDTLHLGGMATGAMFGLQNSNGSSIITLHNS
jgi:T5SS/PEP-CTERM-associated repeat protein